MIPAIEAADHDAGPPPLYSGPLGVLAPVLLDGHRWAVLAPGDMIADHLLGIDMEDASHAPA